jgi:chemotaxis protein MotB
VVAFVFAYYVPLYRAHALLTNQYRKQMDEARAQRKQLTETIDTLKLVVTERDRLAEASRREQKNQDASLQRISKLEENLRAALKKFLGKGKVVLVRQGETIALRFESPAMLGQGTTDLTVFGKQALCAIASSLKTSNARVVVVGGGLTAPPKSEFSFPLAAGRATNVSKHLSEGCGIAVEQLEIRAKASDAKPTLGVEVQVSVD